MVEFDLSDLTIPSARGRAKVDAGFSYVRDLNGGDVEMLLNPPAQGLETSPIKAIRHQHHLLARLLAEGRKAVEASAITGYSQSRISILQNDPAFKELLVYYKENVKAIYLDVHERLAVLGISSVEELQARIEETPEKFTSGQLVDIATMAFDRSVAPTKGGGKTGNNAPVQVQVVFTSAPELLQSPAGTVSTLVIDHEA